MSVTIHTPNTLVRQPIRVFLAGSIDNGAAVDWQKEITRRLTNLFEDDDKVDLEIYNPRNDDWDPSIDPTSDDPALQYQVRWELEALDKADIIAMYIAPNSKSPITLLELGVHAKGNRLVVFCPDKFYRSINVRLTSDWYMVPVFDNEEQWFNSIVETITGLNDFLTK